MLHVASLKTLHWTANKNNTAVIDIQQTFGSEAYAVLSVTKNPDDDTAIFSVNARVNSTTKKITFLIPAKETEGLAPKTYWYRVIVIDGDAEFPVLENGPIELAANPTVTYSANYLEDTTGLEAWEDGPAFALWYAPYYYASTYHPEKAALCFRTLPPPMYGGYNGENAAFSSGYLFKLSIARFIWYFVTSYLAGERHFSHYRGLEAYRSRVYYPNSLSRLVSDSGDLDLRPIVKQATNIYSANVYAEEVRYTEDDLIISTTDMYIHNKFLKTRLGDHSWTWHSTEETEQHSILPWGHPAARGVDQVVDASFSPALLICTEEQWNSRPSWMKTDNGRYAMAIVVDKFITNTDRLDFGDWYMSASYYSGLSASPYRIFATLLSQTTLNGKSFCPYTMVDGIKYVYTTIDFLGETFEHYPLVTKYEDFVRSEYNSAGTATGGSLSDLDRDYYQDFAFWMQNKGISMYYWNASEPHLVTSS